MSDRWCFTINLPELAAGDAGAAPAAAAAAPYTPPYLVGEMAYMVYQREVAPTTGMPHWQGYVRFYTRKRMSTVKELLGRQDAHLEKARGTEEANRTYCTKEGGIMRSGDLGTYDANQGKGQGHRSDLEAIGDKLKAGVHLNVIASEHISDYIRFHSGIEAAALRVAPMPPTERPVSVTVLWGATGVGKTHRVLHQYPDAYPVTPDHPWDFYTNQSVVFFDEFDYSRWTIQQMNRYLDKWRVLVDARYHGKYGVWTRVIICANSSPLSWWPNADQPLVDSFRRRIAGHSILVLSREQVVNFDELRDDL